MSKPTCCPQCQAPLKIPAGLAADKAITCPSCRLKFVPPAPCVGRPTSRAGLIMAVLGIVVFAGAIAGWNWIANQETASPVGTNGVAVGDVSADKLTGESNNAKSASPSVAVAPAPPPSDPSPEPPQPMPKKPAPKTYAETKLSQDNPAAAPAVVAGLDNAQQKQINDAIEKGVAYLKRAQYPTGTWTKNPDNTPQTYSVGYAALGGLTLLECEVPAADPAVQKAAAFVRSTPITDRLHRNYQMACVILFLDRLGDPRDRTLIQTYALHLVAGQTVRGGWTYDSPDLSNVELQQLLNFLEATRIPVLELHSPLDKKDAKDVDRLAKRATKKPAARPPAAVQPVQSLSRPVLNIPLVYLHYFPKGTPPEPRQKDILVSFMPDDNSNAQFAVLALWTARRHGVPTERSLIAAAQKFFTTQNEDGGWGYTGTGGGLIQITHSTPAMTSVGLLGLAMGFAVMPAAPSTGKLPEVPAIAKALTKLGKHIDAADMKNFYFLWSVERVAMLYNLKTIGSRDWYDVGVKMLLPSQDKDGHWASNRYSGSTPTLDTCFALLFLKRSNLMRDLSDRLPFLMAIRDPAGLPKR